MNNESAPAKLAPVREMSLADFALWGLPEIAYVKRTVTEGEDGWSIHAADGTQMGLAPNRDVAFAAVRQHELEPVSVH
jgi:hypothetical protein